MTAVFGADPVRRWVRAILVVFTLLGFGFGSWLSRLPAVRDHLGASTLEMSVYGLCLAVGSVIGLLLSGRTVSRLGPRRTLAVGIAAQALAMPAAATAVWVGLTPVGLALLFAFGFAFSTSDVAMNVSGAAAERALGRPRMPLFHAGFSLGSVSSMGLGALAEAGGTAVPAHLALVYAAVLVAGLAALRAVPREDAAGSPGGGADRLAPPPTTAVTGPIALPGSGVGGFAGSAVASGAGRPYSPWRDPRIVLIGCIAMSMSLAEGTAADWLPLALADGRGLANETGALVLGVFFVSMTLTRLAGSLILARLGRVAVLRGGAILCGVGVAVMILVPTSWGAVLGTLCWGVGAALGFPVSISAAADDPETSVRGVAAVSAIAYTAMLLGPMAFGFLGEHIGLLPSFWVLAAIALASAAISGAARSRPTPPLAGR